MGIPDSNPDKKEKILLAAETLFSQFGFEGVSTRALAREAGVNIAMLSYYFGSKEKLYESTIQYLMDRRRDDFARIFDSIEDPLHKIFALVDYYVDKVFGQGAAYKIFNREISNSQVPGLCNEILDFIMGNMSIIKGFIEEGIENKIFKKVDMEMTLFTLVGTVHHLTHAQSLTRKMFHLNFEEPFLSNEQFKMRLKNHLKNLLSDHLLISKP